MAVRREDAQLPVTSVHVFDTLGALCRVVSGSDLDPAGSVTFPVLGGHLAVRNLRRRVADVVDEFGLVHRFEVQGETATVRVWRRDVH
jgi:hypothetical protein